MLATGLGILAGLVQVLGLLEPVGVRWAGAVNAIGYVGFSVWLLAIGLVFLLA